MCARGGREVVIVEEWREGLAVLHRSQIRLSGRAISERIALAKHMAKETGLRTKR